MFLDGSLHGVKPGKRKAYAASEIIYTLVDFSAAMAFTLGSIMFLDEQLKHTGTWFFIAGSVLFALKPTIRVVREIKLAASGHEEELANKGSSGE